jgi:hypothetical protein
LGESNVDLPLDIAVDVLEIIARNVDQDSASSSESDYNSDEAIEGFKGDDEDPEAESNRNREDEDNASSPRELVEENLADLELPHGPQSNQAAWGYTTESTSTGNHTIPEELLFLRKELLKNYQIPTQPPQTHVKPRQLTRTEELSLRHYIAWRNSNGTVKAYNEHRLVLASASEAEIYSLHRVRKLAADLISFHPKKIDMCPKSCIAYTGTYKDLETCPFVSVSGTRCGAPRFRATPRATKKIPVAQVTILPVIDTIKALFANSESAHQIRHCDACLKAALQTVGTAAQKYSDFGNSALHQYHYNHLNLFQDCRDIAFALSTDGAQLTMKKQSNTWLLILIVLNLPPSIRYTSGNIIINLATPGPNAPGDIESFIRPLFEEMAQASEGIWIWDAVDSSYFVHRAYITMVLGDMLGSAKLSGMAGHHAIFGDRFTLVQGAKSSTSRGARALYYPINPPQNDLYNPFRPPFYDLKNLPMRTEDHYWKAIQQLSLTTLSKQQRTTIVKATGISRLPLCAASEAFIHPTFFPIDPFHLFYENVEAFIWDLWTSISKKGETIHLTEDKARKFGDTIVSAMKTLPPAFCGPVRNPFLKRHSQYKVYEWMALLHWYTLPIGMELGFDPYVLDNYANLVKAIEFAMSIKPRSDAEIAELHLIIQKFLIGFEELYIGKNPENISRLRLCIFQLIHVPIHIKWNGSIRVSSQATVERSIGEVGHRIRSKKLPFENLANIITEKELIRILNLYYPSLSQNKAPYGNEPSNPDSESIATENKQRQKNSIKLIQSIGLSQRDSKDPFIAQQLASVQHYAEHIIGDNQRNDSRAFKHEINIQRWGKARLANGHLLRSQISDKNKPIARQYRWFEVIIS